MTANNMAVKLKDELKPCPLCGLKMYEFDDGNFGHSREYKSGVESTCPLRGQLFHVSERRAWMARPEQGNKEITLSRERVAKKQYELMYGTLAIEEKWELKPENSPIKKFCYECANAIISDLKNLIEVVK